MERYISSILFEMNHYRPRTGSGEGQERARRGPLVYVSGWQAGRATTRIKIQFFVLSYGILIWCSVAHHSVQICPQQHMDEHALAERNVTLRSRGKLQKSLEAHVVVVLGVVNIYIYICIYTLVYVYFISSSI